MIREIRWTRDCPEDCKYRNRQADFCGYCMLEILTDRRKENGNGSEQNEAEDDEQAVREGL